MFFKKLKSLFALFTGAGVVFFYACQHDPLWRPPQSQQNGNPSGDEICFETEILPNLVSGCGRSGCHNGSSSEGNFTTYAGLMAAKVINTEKPSESEIIEVLRESRDNKRMPPPPDARWSEDKIQKLLKWIEQGAQNTTNCRTTCDTFVFTFTKVKAIMDQYCAGCHSGNSPGGGIFLTNYSSIKVQADNGKLIGTIRHQSGFKPMPQGGNPLPECDIRIIEKWIGDGSNDN